MTVWANWTQVDDRIDVVIGADLREWRNVMHVNEPCGFRPVDGSKTEAADSTDRTIMFNALVTGDGVPLVSVDSDLRSCPFNQRFRGGNFLGQRKNDVALGLGSCIFRGKFAFDGEQSVPRDGELFIGEKLTPWSLEHQVLDADAQVVFPAEE